MFGGAKLIRNVQGQVTERIGTGITRGDVPPGETLPSEIRVSEMLAVIRTAVRETSRVLVGKGLIEAR